MALATPRSFHPPALRVRSGCPLSPARQLAAVNAFKKMMPVFRHPRCANCHGGVNPFLDGTGADPVDNSAPVSTVAHGGGRIARQDERAADGTLLIETECQDCHNHMAPRRDGSNSIWFTAPSFLSFVGKDATAICRQVKRTSHDAKDLVGHMTDDNGFNNFATTGFNGDRALDPDRYDITPEPPPMSHEAFIRLGEKWVAAMGGELQGDESCGCVMPKLELTMKSEVTGTSPEGKMSGDFSATVPLKPDSSGERLLGEGPIRYGGLRTPPMPPQCSATYQPGTGTVTVSEAVLTADDAGHTDIELTLAPADQPGRLTLRCTGLPRTLDMPSIPLAQEWKYSHEQDRKGRDFVFRDFEDSPSAGTSGGRTLVGRKELSRSVRREGVDVASKTTLELWALQADADGRTEP